MCFGACFVLAFFFFLVQSKFQALSTCSLFFFFFNEYPTLKNFLKIIHTLKIKKLCIHHISDFFQLILNSERLKVCKTT